MASNNISAVYIGVIDDVISKVRDEFVSTGAGDGVLLELQALWEAKMLQCGAVSGTIDRSTLPKPAGNPITPVHDLNVPYEGPIEEYETPTAEMLFPPTPMQTPLPGTAQTPLPGMAQTPVPGMVQTPLPGTDYNIPTGPSDYSPAHDIRNGVDIKYGQAGPYMQSPSPWMNQRPLGVDVNVAYVEGRDEVDRGVQQQTMQDFFMMPSGKRKRDDYPSQMGPGGYIPQQDGSGDVIVELSLPQESRDQNLLTGCSKGSTSAKSLSSKEANSFPFIPQLDGEYENDLFHFQGVAHEDYNTPVATPAATPAEHVELRVGTPVVGTPKQAKTEAVDDDEPPLNEDDDDEEDLDELERAEEEPNTQHLVLAQFEKVSRTKSRWKCILKCGIMHLNSRDILFNKANGEFEF